MNEGMGEGRGGEMEGRRERQKVLVECRGGTVLFSYRYD